MKYLLDTNTCIRYLNGRSPAVFEHLNALSPAEVCVCSVVKFELRYDALRSDNVDKTLAAQAKFLQQFESLPFDDEAHQHAAQIRAYFRLADRRLGSRQ